MNIINNLLPWIWKNKKLVPYVALVFLSVSLIHQCKKTNYANLDKQRLQNNIDALNDVVRTEKLKNGETIYLKKAFETKLDDIAKYNKQLAEEVEKLDAKTKKQLQFIQKIDLTLKNGGYKVNNDITELPDSTFAITFGHEEDELGYHRDLKAETKVKVFTDKDKLGLTDLGTTIIKDDIGFSLVTGIKRGVNNQPEIFVTPISDKVKISDIQGAVIDPKNDSVLKDFMKDKRRFGVGPQAGVTITPSLQFMPYIGVGVQYNIIKF